MKKQKFETLLNGLLKTPKMKKQKHSCLNDVLVALTKNDTPKQLEELKAYDNIEFSPAIHLKESEQVQKNNSTNKHFFMTDKEAQETIAALKRVTAEACKSPETARQFLIDAGIIDGEKSRPTPDTVDGKTVEGFTPGKWEVIGSKNVRNIYGNNGQTIVAIVDGFDQDEKEANATLISQAPKLLRENEELKKENETLKAHVSVLREALEYVLECVNHPNFTDRHGIIGKMKQAIKQTM